MNLPLNTRLDTADDLEHARYNMIHQQIRPWSVGDEATLGTLARVRREEFVPPQFRALAFADMELPLPCGQCMLPPRIEARLLQDLRLQGGERVLEIGTGSGYMAALLAQHAEIVLSVDIHAPLLDMACHNLRRHNVTNVELRECDASRPENLPEGTFDVILLSGSVAQVPPFLPGLLSSGGRLAAIVGQELSMRATFAWRKGTEFEVLQPWDASAPRLCGFADENAPFAF